MPTDEHTESSSEETFLSASAAPSPLKVDAAIEAVLEEEDDDMVETDEGSTTDDEDEDDGSSGMPLLKYTRLFGSLERNRAVEGSPLANECTCSVMGKAIIEAALPEEESNVTALWQQQSIPILALGFANGTVSLVDALTATAVVPTDQLQVRTDRHKEPIVGLSFDASGTQLAAIDQGGMCTIFTDLKYSIQMQSRGPDTPVAQGNAFSSFMSAFTGQRESGTATVTTTATDLVPTLVSTPPTVQRVSYPKSFGKPTCVAIDPAYKARREKSLFAGFADGRLVLTKRGAIFQRRTDSIVYQAVPEDPNHFDGIQAIVWRGPLVAFADGSGVRLLDSETLVRIAHVDRPTGARPTLYPTVSHLTPYLCFETAQNLLVAWGDCLLDLKIKEGRQMAPVQQQQQQTATVEDQAAAGESSSSSPRPPPPPSSPSLRRRTVECTMAWQLDCVACGLAPLDQDYVMVLGLVPDEDGKHTNDIELQVVSRFNGSVLYSDLLPIVRPKKQGWGRGNKADAASSFRLLSTFAVTRMDNTAELQSEGSDMDDAEHMTIFTQPERRTFIDSHLKWNLKLISFDEEPRRAEPGSDDDGSVDSDDYGILAESIKDQPIETSSRLPDPPIMIVSSSHDTVLARMREVDDAVSFALEEKRAGLALRRGLAHVRQLRQYSIRDLVNEYFRALLRLPGSDEKVQEGKETKHLSMRRMKLATEAMPVLLGADSEMWNRWVRELEKIPGALFVVRSHLPVRDPILPKEVYGRVLDKMLAQVEQMAASSAEDASLERLTFEAEGHFLHALLAWGPTLTLNEYIKLYKKNAVAGNHQYANAIRSLEESYARRRGQTSANYLRIGTDNAHTVESEDEQDQARTPSAVSSGTDAPLFDLDEVLSKVRRRVNDVPLSVQSMEPTDTSRGMNGRVALDAVAKLQLMHGSFDEALRFYLLIGLYHPPKSWTEIEDEAVSLVNQQNEPKQQGKVAKEFWYSYVLSIIGNHHLHQCLLDEHFMFKDEVSPPLFSLARLVGLQLMGDFLVENCVAPQNKQLPAERRKSGKASSRDNDRTGWERRGTLPIDLVAKQFEGSQKLLLWYLHLIFTRKPSVYVVFPHTTNPPPIITQLHRKNIELYIKFAGDYRDSSKALASIDAYRVMDVSTPLQSFLKTVLPLGGIPPAEVAKTLESERRGGSGVSGIFSLELAYIMEHFGDDSEDEARLILELYFKGAKSLMLAVAYAQRVKEHSAVLWEILTDHCLSEWALSPGKSGAAHSSDGSLFGSLLEAAALSGADLAHLVKQIPTGMAIEGLRPRLVAAVADYRLKLQMRQSASEIANMEKVALLRELAHRSRRGCRIEGMQPSATMGVSKTKSTSRDTQEEKPEILSPTLRTIKRQDQFKLSYSLPIR